VQSSTPSTARRGSDRRSRQSEVLPPKEEGRAFFSFELFYDNINGMTKAQQEAKRNGRIESLKRAAQKRKAQAV
jgi:hypothetical protein